MSRRSFEERGERERRGRYFNRKFKNWGEIREKHESRKQKTYRGTRGLTGSCKREFIKKERNIYIYIYIYRRINMTRYLGRRIEDRSVDDSLELVP